MKKLQHIYSPYFFELGAQPSPENFRVGFSRETFFISYKGNLKRYYIFPIDH